MLDYLNQQNGQQFLKKEADSLKNLYTFSKRKGMRSEPRSSVKFMWA